MFNPTHKCSNSNSSSVVAGYEYDGGIIITASHLPFNRNGFKFFTKDGGLEKGDIKDILQRAAAASHASGMTPNARHTDDALVLDAALNIDPSSAPKVSNSWCLLHTSSSYFFFIPPLHTSSSHFFSYFSAYVFFTPLLHTSSS